MVPARLFMSRPGLVVAHPATTTKLARKTTCKTRRIFIIIFLENDSCCVFSQLPQFRRTLNVTDEYPANTRARRVNDQMLKLIYQVVVANELQLHFRNHWLGKFH